MVSSTRRITFGDDHSTGADIAWGWICAQTWPGWTVDVVTVTSPPPQIESLFMHDPLHEHVPDQPRIAIPATGLAAVRHLTTAYDPRIVLTEKHDADLMVVGARGRGLLKSMRIGSTAEWLMRCPSTPLVIARDAAPVRTVLVAVDGSADAAAAVAALAALPWIRDCSVHVVSILEGDDVIRQGNHDAVEVLEAAGARVTARMIDNDASVISMNPRVRILDVIDEQQPDLVALGTSGRTGVPRLVIGSVAGGIAHASPCSVLVARRETELPHVPA